MCPKYLFPLLPWLQSFSISPGTLEPGLKAASPTPPCSCLSSQATKSRPLRSKQKCLGALGGLLERQEVSILPFLCHVAWSFQTRESSWRWRQRYKAERKRLGPQCGVECLHQCWSIHFWFSFVWKNLPPWSGPYYHGPNTGPNSHGWAPIQTRHGSPGLVSQLSLVANKSSTVVSSSCSCHQSPSESRGWRDNALS